MTDAELWQLTRDARPRSEAAEREAKAEPSVEAQARWLKFKVEYERARAAVAGADWRSCLTNGTALFPLRFYAASWTSPHPIVGPD